MKRTPTLSFSYDESIDRGMRSRSFWRRMTVATERDVVAALRHAERLLLTTHENPDGDALGSLLAMHGILEQLGKDVLMYMSPDEFPLPWEYRHWTFDSLVGAPPDDLAERTIVFLDCGNIDRMPVDFLQPRGCTSSTSTTTTTTRASAP